MDAPSLLLLATHCPSWLSMHGIVIARCAHLQGTDAVVVLVVLNY
jgi:hypothetical protein